MATGTKERELNIEPVCVGAHLYQPVELDYKSSPWRSDNVMILNSLAVGLSHIAELLNFTFLALILHTYPSDVRIVHSPLRYPLFQLLFTIHHFFVGLISFTFWPSDPLASSLSAGRTTDITVTVVSINNSNNNKNLIVF
jgi:hypothetical protein